MIAAPSHRTTLLGLLLYIYAVLGVNLFGGVDQRNWGSLGQALLTLLRDLAKARRDAKITLRVGR